MNKLHQISKILLFVLLFAVIDTSSFAQGNKLISLWKRIVGGSKQSAEILQQSGKNISKEITSQAPKSAAPAAAAAPSVAASTLGVENKTAPLIPQSSQPAQTLVPEPNKPIEKGQETPSLETRMLDNMQINLDRTTTTPSRKPVKAVKEETSSLSDIINSQVIKQTTSPAIQKYFSFRNGEEAVESLMVSANKFLATQYTQEETLLILNTFKWLDKRFFASVPNRKEMIPLTQQLYSKSFYNRLSNNSKLAVKNPQALLDKAGLNDVLTLIDTKMWFVQHKGQLPRLDATASASEVRVAVRFYGLFQQAQNNALPSYLSPLKRVTLDLAKPVRKNISLTTWTNFTENWLKNFNDQELVKFMIKYHQNPNKREFFDDIASGIRASISARDLTQLEAGKTLYLLGTSNATAQQTLSMLNWWLQDGPTLLPTPFPSEPTFTAKTNYSQQLIEAREGILFDNLLSTLNSQGQTAAQIRELLLPLAQNNLQQTAQKLERVKQFLDQGEIKQGDVAELHNAIQNPLLKALLPRETAQLSVQIQTFNKSYDKYRDVANFLDYCSKYPGTWYYEEEELVFLHRTSFVGKRFEFGGNVTEIQETINELRALGFPTANKLEAQLQRLIKNGERRYEREIKSRSGS